MSDVMDVGTMSDHEEQKGIGITTTDVTKTKPIPHIAPRIDPEYYQAQVLDIGTINGISSSSVTDAERNWYGGNQLVSTTATSRQQVIKDFLAIYRNIFESGEVPGGIINDSAVIDHDPTVVSASLWTAENVDEVSLESDGEALEYLARHDFDGEEAAAALYLELGFGKACVLAHRAQDLAQKYSQSTVFHEAKDRLLMVPVAPMAGAFANTSSLMTRDRPQQQQSPQGGPQQAMVISVQPQSANNSSNNLEGSNSNSSSNSNINGLEGESAAIDSNNNNNNNNNNEHEAVQAAEDKRATRGPISHDKGARGRWAALFERACSLLQRTSRAPGTSAGGSSSGSASSGTGGGGGPHTVASALVAAAVQSQQLLQAKAASKQGKGKAAAAADNASAASANGGVSSSDLAEAQAILEEAAGLPSIVNAPGECFAETMRAVLGELLVAVADARAWDAEVADALCPAEALLAIALANGDRYTHDTHTRLGATAAAAMASSARSSSQPCVWPTAGSFSMKDFRKLVKEGAGLRLRTDTERRLKQSVAKVNSLFKRAHAILSVRGNIRDALGDSGNSSSSVGKGGSVGRGAKGSSTSSGGSSSSTRPGSNSSLLLHSPSSSSRSKDKDKESEAAGSTGSGRARLGSSTKGNKARDDNNNNSSSSADAVARALVQANANAAAASLSDDEDEDDDEEALDGTDAGGGGKAGTGAFTLADVSEVLLGLDRLPPGLVAARDRVETLYSVRQGKGASSNNATTVFVFAAAVGSHSSGHDATSATSSSSSSGMQCLHLSPLDVLKRLYEVSSALAAAADELMDLSAVATTLKTKLTNANAATGSQSEATSEPVAVVPATSAPPPRFTSSSWLASLSRPLSAARSLSDALSSHGVTIARAEEVEALVAAAEAWKKEVSLLAPNSSSSSVSEASKPASLRRVETLFLEGERFPFELTPELDILREKRAQAKVWLDKLKRTMSQPKGGKRARSERGASGGGAQSSSLLDGGGGEQDRPNLADIRMMVMAEDDDNDNDNDAGNDGGAGAGGQGRGFTSHRELSKVQSVVEIAEEWLSRVREALVQSAAMRAQRQRNRLARHQQSTASSSSNNNNEATAAASSSSDPQATVDTAAAGDGEDDGDVGEEYDSEAADPLEDLQDLLKESDEMPVYMEEAALLRTHLLALEWANKAALVLPLHATTTTSEEGPQDGHDSSDGSGVGTGSVTMVVQPPPQQQQRLPRLVEVQRLAKEIRRIRSTAITQQQQQQQGAAGSKAADDWERGMSLELPEEVVCLQIVTDAEAWLAKLKKVLVSSSSSSSQSQGSAATSTGNAAVKAGSSLSRLRDLLAEGRRVPVNLDYEMRPLKAAIETAQEWLQQHAELLRALGVIGAPADTAAVGMDVVVVSTKIPYEKLFGCVNAASGISATFFELTAVREILRETDEWLAAAERCERPHHQQQSHRRAAKSSDQTSQARASASRRKGHHQSLDNQDGQDQDGFGQDDQDEAVVMTTTTTTTTTTSSYDEVSSSSSSSAPHRDVLLSLLAHGQVLGVDVSAEMEMIEGALAAIDDWEGSAGQALRDLDRLVAPVVQGYRRLATATAAKPKTGGEASSSTTISQLPPLPFPSFEAASSSDDYDDDDDDDDDDSDGNDDDGDNAEGSKAKATAKASLEDSKGDAKKDNMVKHEDKPKDKNKNKNKNDKDAEEDALALAMRRCVEEEADQWGKFVDFYVEVQRMQREASDLGVGLPQPSATGSKGKEDHAPPAASTNSFVTLELSAAALYWIYSVRKLLLYPSMQQPNDDPRLVTNVPTTSSSSGSHSRASNGGSAGQGAGAKGKGETAGARPSKKKDKKGAAVAAGETTATTATTADAGASAVDAGGKMEDSSSSSSSSDHKEKDGDGDGNGDAAESPRVAAASKGGGVVSDLGFGDVPLDLILSLIRDAESYFENIAAAAAPATAADGVSGSIVNADHISSVVVGRLAAMEAVYASSALANTPPPPPPPPLKEEVVEADADVGDVDADDAAAAERKRRKVDTGDEGGDDGGEGQDADEGGGDDSLAAMAVTGAEDAAEGHELDNNGKRKKRTTTTHEDSTTINTEQSRPKRARKSSPETTNGAVAATGMDMDSSAGQETSSSSAKSKRRNKDQGSYGGSADGGATVRGTRGQQQASSPRTLLAGGSAFDHDHDPTGLRAAVLRQQSPPSSSPRSAVNGGSQAARGPIAQVLTEVAALGHTTGRDDDALPPQLPPHLEEMLDFWLRCLRLLERRVSQASLWSKHAHDSLTRALLKTAAASARQRWEEDAVAQLREARVKNLQLRKRVVVEEYLETARAWSRVAADILNHGKGGSRGKTAAAAKEDQRHKSSSLSSSSSSSSLSSKKAGGDHAKASVWKGKGRGKVSFEVLKEFIRAGEQLPSDRPEMVELKQELKKGKSWLARFNRAGLTGKSDDDAAASSSSSGGGGGVVGLAEVQALVSEAKDLCIDVTAELEVAAQATRKYCLCRQPYHGHMIGCDECDDWYHFQCVGLTQLQADKADKWLCIRCNLRNSFRQTANLVAQVTNRWCAPSEAMRFQDARRSKTAKRLAKEEKEVNRLLSYIESLGGGGVQLQQQQQQQQQQSAASGGSPRAAQNSDGAGAGSSGVADAVTSTNNNHNKESPGEDEGDLTKTASASEGSDSAAPPPTTTTVMAVDGVESESGQGLAIASQPSSASSQQQQQQSMKGAISFAVASSPSMPLSSSPRPSKAPHQIAAALLSAEEEEMRRMQINHAKGELREAFERLTRARQEEEECQRQSVLEEERREEATEWMLAMQGVLWPENAADCELGRPVISDPPNEDAFVALVATQVALNSPPSSTASGSFGGRAPVDVQKLGENEVLIDGKKRMFTFYAPIPTVPVGAPATLPAVHSTAAPVAGVPRAKDLLPYGMRNALDAAVMLGIAEITDVDTIIESFRWMAWCFYCIHVLRLPPATHTLRNLLKCARLFKLADDKVIRNVTGILQRASLWKAKARKLILSQSTVVSGQQRRVDSTKLHSLVSEVATVPLTSSVKDCILNAWEDLVQRAAITTTTTTTTAASSHMAEGGGDTLAKTSSETAAAAASTGAAAAGSTAKRAPKVNQLAVPGIAAFAYLPSETMYLSDDEANDSSSSDSTLDNPQANLLASLPNSKDIILTPLPPHSWAPPCSNIITWPPALAVSRYLPRKMVPSAVAYPSLPSLAIHK